MILCFALSTDMHSGKMQWPSAGGGWVYPGGVCQPRGGCLPRKGVSAERRGVSA